MAVKLLVFFTGQVRLAMSVQIPPDQITHLLTVSSRGADFRSFDLFSRKHAGKMVSEDSTAKQQMGKLHGWDMVIGTRGG